MHSTCSPVEPHMDTPAGQCGLATRNQCGSPATFDALLLAARVCLAAAPAAAKLQPAQGASSRGQKRGRSAADSWSQDLRRHLVVATPGGLPGAPLAGASTPGSPSASSGVSSDTELAADAGAKRLRAFQSTGTRWGCRPCPLLPACQ